MNRRWTAVLFATLTAALFSGCTMCCPPDDSYGYYGDLYSRSDPVHGRAGSILSGGGEVVTDNATATDDGDEMLDDDGGVYYEDGE